MNIISRTRVEILVKEYLNKKFPGITIEIVGIVTEGTLVIAIKFYATKTYPFNAKYAEIKNEMISFNSDFKVETVNQSVVATAKSKISAYRVLESQTYLS